ncbi:Fe-S cluster assembly protein SufD [Photobacterium proteolyticum]|uniref:Fe-S cluster assembly protein SufD n=1 Tax=Photobacterium proteolyticum TaxID=1903952 RepID=A0A1Q9GJ54_9GAMM|nr:Fe-S cluster assembly protein SufD [Photobacterium proteolyticum]OLQ74486.1 Fe-S cluster assembly protein SufD [Photobacterium proteolyticum]
MNTSERFCHAYSQYRNRFFEQPENIQHLSWLKQLQDNAFESFSTQGLPGPRDENWKYTQLSQIEQLDLQPSDQNSVSSHGIRPENIPLCSGSHRLVFMDGKFTPELSNHADLPDGLILCSIAQGLNRHPHLLSAALGAVAEYNKHPFAALNTMFLADGALLQVMQGCKVQMPIHCLFYTTEADRPVMYSPRLLLLAEDNAEVTVIEHYQGNSRSLLHEQHQNSGLNLTNALTEVTLGRDTTLHHYKLQCESGNTCHIAGIHVEQQQSSQFYSHNISLGACLARNDLCIKLADTGAECHLYGAYCIGDRQHVDFHTQIDHLRPNCQSSELYKGVIQDRAHAVFNGMVVVHPDAQYSDAQLINKNLLLSAKAEVDTKPELQIYADDVKCSHGATVGQLDPAAMFYLQSRGISHEAAQTLLITAFINDILQPVEPAPIRQLLLPSIQAQLNRLIHKIQNREEQGS